MVGRDVGGYRARRIRCGERGRVRSAEEPVAVRGADAVGDIGKVLAAHHLRRGHHHRLAEVSGERVGDLLGDVGVVVGQWRVLEVLDVRFTRAVRRLALGGDDAADRVEQCGAHRLAVAADVDLDLGGVGDDVGLGAGQDAAHCQHRGVGGVDLAGDDRL